MVWFERAPAKVNLSLNVLGKRDDGFHEVEMIMTAVDLADRVELYPLKGNRIQVSADNQYVPNDERSLAYKAAAAFKRRYHIDKGVNIEIEKNIPVSAGLGGGSSDAAAVLRGLNRMWSVGARLDDLAAIGAEIGSDVPFCIYSNTALGTGHGEKVQRLPSPPPCYMVLAKPNIGITTRVIFQNVTISDLKHPETEQIVQALKEKNFTKLCDNIGNSLETVTFSLYPEVRRLKKKMEQAGASGVLISGSGPTVVGLVEHMSKARRIYNGLRGFCDEVFIVQSIDRC